MTHEAWAAPMPTKMQMEIEEKPTMYIFIGIGAAHASWIMDQLH